MEARATDAIAAMDVLVELVDSQDGDASIPSKQLAPLMRLVFAAVERAMPDYRALYSANDRQ